MRSSTTMMTGMLAAMVAACSPGLDWREFEPEGSGVVVSFPCRPDRLVRSVPLAGAPVRMEMLVCSVSGTTFALTFADVPDPSSVGPALAELRALAAINIGAPPATPSAWQVPGMTPSAQASRITVSGRRGDGRPVEEQATFFSKGRRVYQASVVGEHIAPEAASSFLAAPRFPR